MINPKVFRMAAEMVFREQEACCPAIRKTLVFSDKRKQDDHIYFFQAFFSPDKKKDIDGLGRYFGSQFLIENKLARSLALLLCEKIAEEEILK